MDKYAVTGMSCAACQAKVEKAVNSIEGVTSCSVSLLTNSMGVEGNVTPDKIIKAVEDAGYGASLMNTGKNKGRSSFAEQEELLKDKTTPVLKNRLISSLIFLVVLMYFSMGHMLLGWPLPAYFDGNHVAMGLVQLLLCAIIMVINQKFFISGFKSLFHRAPNMDTLVALGASAAFIYSTVALFLMTDAVVKGDEALTMSYMEEFYFESAATILTLITVGKLLESISKGRTTNALKSLMKLSPKTATLIRDDKEIVVDIEDVEIGDIFVVRPGENIPVDGIVIEGNSAVNESALTGESIPVDKEAGSKVSAATINQSGFIKCKATRVGEDTTLSQIIQMVSDAAATKAPIAKIADTVSGVFVPSVIVIAFITFIVWMFVGETFGYALARAISVLVISCPCALGLATPVAIMVGNGMGAKNGIMFKTAVSLEETGKTQIVALDKTGTITEGKPQVTDIIVFGEYTRDQLLVYASSLESKSEHPLASAIMEYAVQKNIAITETTDFEALPGNGLRAKMVVGDDADLGINDQGVVIYGGNAEYISKIVTLPDEAVASSDRLATEGKTPLFFAIEDNKTSRLMGIIAVADVIKSDSASAIKELKNMGIHVVMLTGDNEKTANAIGQQAGVSEVIASVRPDGKEEVVNRLKNYGKVTMIGDGINDAPALTRADIGIAIGAGTDVAIDAADVVLMKSSLSDAVAAIRLSRATLRNIHENLFWAFIYNVIGIPLAAGVFVRLFGWSLNPMFGAAAMSLSSFCVVSNALRLNLFKMHDASKDRRLKNAVKVNTNGKLLDESQVNNKTNMEEIKMTKTISIEGMMCEHCEASVKKALEALDGVAEAKVSHKEGTAVVSLSGDVADEALKSAVEAKDYKVTDIK
ncbi:MAG: heavy metal translocating P-type ATPase [Butyrivibrio sp.]|nr:heavy metal translocating P-type ATPase [Butyrivibrio sp.]